MGIIDGKSHNDEKGSQQIMTTILLLGVKRFIVPATLRGGGL